MSFINRKKILILFILVFSFRINAQTEQECRVYLNFPYYSYEITGGFSQVYKIASRYSLLSQECHSFLSFMFTNKMLNQYLFSDSDDACKVSYEKLFNSCRCDTSTFLYIFRAPVNKAVQNDEKVFDKKIFDASLNMIRDSTLKALTKLYPNYFIKIEIASAPRTMADQEKYLKKGSSTTLFSAHILGAAADFEIYFNGRLVNPKPKGMGIFQSFVPYCVLGRFILNQGYFWGIPWDPGHMQLKRKLDEILVEYPDLQNDGNLIATYCNVIKLDSIPIKYKPVIEILDQKFGVHDSRIYDLSVPWIEDTLLVPVDADTIFNPLSN